MSLAFIEALDDKIIAKSAESITKNIDIDRVIFNLNQQSPPMTSNDNQYERYKQFKEELIDRAYKTFIKIS